MFSSQDPQSLDVCPYNSSHRILKYRMGTHIVKCRKLHQGDSAMTICLFNATHSIPEAELKYHLENCPDRINLDKQVLISKDVDQSKFPIQTVDVTNEENWDDEDVPTYKPEEYCEKNPILRQAKVESAATRKNFRVAERLRIQQLKDAGPNKDGGSRNAPNKFRSNALANTITNITEAAPYTYETIQRMIESRAPKPVITSSDQKPVFVHHSDPETKSTEEAEEGAQACALSSSTASTDDVDPPSKEEEEFVMPKSRKKVGRGRGRGVSR